MGAAAIKAPPSDEQNKTKAMLVVTSKSIEFNAIHCKLNELN